MDEPEARKKIIEVELDILRALCQGTPQRIVWDDGMRLLRNYAFQDHVHQLLFDTLRELNTGAPQIIREQLPPRITKKGFPALDLETYFQPHHLTALQAISLMRALRALPQGEERPDALAR